MAKRRASAKPRMLGLARALLEQARDCFMQEGDFYPQQVDAMRLLVKIKRFVDEVPADKAGPARGSERRAVAADRARGLENKRVLGFGAL